MPLSAQSTTVLAPVPLAAVQTAQRVLLPLQRDSSATGWQDARSDFSEIFARSMADLSPEGLPTPQPMDQTEGETALQGPISDGENPARQAPSPKSAVAKQAPETLDPTTPELTTEDPTMMPILAQPVLGMLSHHQIVAPENATRNSQDLDLPMLPAGLPDQIGKTEMQQPDRVSGFATSPEAQSALRTSSDMLALPQTVYDGFNPMHRMSSVHTDAVLPMLMPRAALIPVAAQTGDHPLPKPVPDRLPIDQGAVQQPSQSANQTAPISTYPAMKSAMAMPANGPFVSGDNRVLPALDGGHGTQPGLSSPILNPASTLPDQPLQPPRQRVGDPGQVRVTHVDASVLRSDPALSNQQPGHTSTILASQTPGSVAAVAVAPRAGTAENSVVIPMIALSPAPPQPDPKPTLAASDRILVDDLTLLSSGPMAAPPRIDAMEARSGVPRPVTQQLLDASVRAIERPVELHLSPEDLGRVRISMTFSEASVTLNVHAERTETLELLRCHSEQLAQELRELGYGMISFSFGQGNRGQEGGPDIAPAGPDQDMSDPLATLQSMPKQPRNETGLDIRV